MVAIPQAHRIDLGEAGQLVLDTDLTPAKVAKFKGLIDRLIVIDNMAYLRLDELHGVLMTSGRQQARDIVMAHYDLVKLYLVRDRVKFEPFGVASAIRPAGIYLLLDHLTTINAKRAPEYRASLVLLSYIMAKHPGVVMGDWRRAKIQFHSVSRTMRSLKKLHSVCQLTGYPFHSGDEKHVHHVQGKSENPSLADVTENLVVIHGWVHDDYHSWTSSKGMPVCYVSLGLYAVKKGFSTPFVDALKAYSKSHPNYGQSVANPPDRDAADRPI